MLHPIITLTTDFGGGSPYVAQMKGVILSINPLATVVDITHDVPPQDIRAGALVLVEATTRFPDGSIHVAVVDPGVGTERAIVIAELGGRCYVGPDNGLFALLSRTSPASSIIAVTNDRFWLPEVSNTFHGRDIMAPVAAHRSLGVGVEEFGTIRQTLVQLPWPAVGIKDEEVHGEIVAVDSFGNLITNVTRQHLSALRKPAELTVHCGGLKLPGLVKTYASQPAGSWVALFGSGGFLEIAIVQGNAHRRSGVGVGTPVVIGALRG